MRKVSSPNVKETIIEIAAKPHLERVLIGIKGANVICFEKEDTYTKPRKCIGETHAAMDVEACKAMGV